MDVIGKQCPGIAGGECLFGDRARMLKEIVFVGIILKTFSALDYSDNDVMQRPPARLCGHFAVYGESTTTAGKASTYVYARSLRGFR